MAIIRVFLLAAFVLTLAGCGGAEPPPEALPLRGWEGEELDVAEDSSPPEPAGETVQESSEAVPVAQAAPTEDPYAEAREVAAFDTFIIETFGHLVGPSDYYGVQLLFGMHCNGMIGDTGVDYRYGDDAQELITSFSQSDCAEIEKSPMFVSSPSMNHATWDEMIDTRFARAVPWSNRQVFDDRARQACRLEESSFDIGLDDRFSRSAAVEIASIVSTGECVLIDTATGISVSDETLELAFGDRLATYTDDERICIQDTFDEFSTTGGPPPAVIVAQFGRLCAEDSEAERWADVSSGPQQINLPDRERRLCFASSVLYVANRDFRESLTWFPSDRFDPPGDRRLQVDAILEISCSIDKFEGVTAGLRDLGPVQSTQVEPVGDDTTLFGVLDQIRFSDDWILDFVGDRTLQSVAARVDAGEIDILSMPISPRVAPTQEMLSALWESTDDVMAKAGFSLSEHHTCVKDQASEVKIYSRADSVTSDALVGFYPDGQWTLFITVAHPVRAPDYIQDSLAKWCLA